MTIRIKRAYEPPSKSDGARILIDGLWPRGVTKEKAEIAEWMKEVAVSPALRKWFSHDPAKWPEFRKRYRAELAGKLGAVARLRERARKGTLTIVYGAKDEAHNNAVVLKEFLESRGGKARIPNRGACRRIKDSNPEGRGELGSASVDQNVLVGRARLEVFRRGFRRWIVA